jgi:chromosome segregation protein
LRLISLELHGFKSFPDAQKLSFPNGMTAVVGPNGCGKSNISDSLAWVLGEQRASMLRGSEMSDVIFAGAGGRKPMGLAEVKLALEMPDPALPGATKEIIISRRLYRDTGSEYRINGREARLKDVQDLLLDTGMGTRAYSFIQQGQIDLILSSKPKDRRSLLEEAAGITRYKLRRQEAEKRLEETKSNLLRLDDILHELGKQMDSLRRQAAKARRAVELDTEIKATQRVLLAGKAVESERAKQRILDQLDALERRLAELTAQASEKASEVEQLRLSVDEQNAAQARRARSVMALDQKLGLLEQERGFQESRREEAKTSQERLHQRLEELTTRLAESSTGFEALEKQLAQASSALEGHESLLSGAEEAVMLAMGAMRKLETELHDLKQQKQLVIQATLQRQKQKLGFQAQIAQLEGRLDSLNHEESVRAPRLEGLQSEAVQLGKSLEASSAHVEQAEEASQVQRRKVAELEDAQRDLIESLHRSEGELDSAERRLRQLTDMVNQFTGSAEIKKGLEWLAERGTRPPLFTDLLKVEESARPDLERLLGAWLQTASVTESELRNAAGATGQLLLAIDTDSHAPAAPFQSEPLRNFLRWSGKTTPLRALVERSFRCTDEQMPSYARQHPELAFVSPRFVKLPFGPIQLGVAAPGASPLKLKSELEDAKVLREHLLTQLETLETRQKHEGGSLMEARERAREIEDDLRSARLRREQQTSQKTSVDAQLAEIKTSQERADTLWEQIEGEIKRLSGLLRELEEHPEEGQDHALEDSIHQSDGLVRESQLFLDGKREIRLEVARTRDAAWAERDHLQRQVQMHQRGRFDIEAEKQRLELESKELTERDQVSAQRLMEMESETQQLLKEREQFQVQMQEANPILEEAQEHLRVQERGARELQEALENARHQHQEVMLQGAQVQGSLEALSKEVELALGLEVPAFLASITDPEREAWSEGEIVHQTRLNELQGKRLELGGVNPLAIQELEEAEERLGFMNQQRTDVTDAIQNLETTIIEINQTSEERFREAFEYINAKFSEVFREVFGGGAAHLSLQDPKDVLECGIEITAQPPGKTAKALTLLSGGEKALTAISLLFAIFHFKPSPFCVLDEVDAPLDEANVARFAGLVQKMKSDTQFIVITHQKPTMVAADTLYGVTQDEPGCSRLVSVQLKEAEQLV